jgi:hypothetical protein
LPSLEQSDPLQHHITIIITTLSLIHAYIIYSILIFTDFLYVLIYILPCHSLCHKPNSIFPIQLCGVGYLMMLSVA